MCRATAQQLSITLDSINKSLLRLITTLVSKHLNSTNVKMRVLYLLCWVLVTVMPLNRLLSYSTVNCPQGGPCRLSCHMEQNWPNFVQCYRKEKRLVFISSRPLRLTINGTFFFLVCVVLYNDPCKNENAIIVTLSNNKSTKSWMLICAVPLWWCEVLEYRFMLSGGSLLLNTNVVRDGVVKYWQNI